MKEFLGYILKREVQEFIIKHENDDVHELLLKHKAIHGVPMEWIASQINGRQKVRNKLPSWYKKEKIVYPPSINLEQCSSEATAKFKLHLLQGLRSSVDELGRGVDLTGGFGVDSLFLSRQAKVLDYVEPHLELLEIARHNHRRFGDSNIDYHPISAGAFLENTSERFDFIYIDPSRRKSTQKVYRLADCDPDVVKLQAVIGKRADHVLIKASPLLDIQEGCKALSNVIQVIVVSVENECKELLFLLQKNFVEEPTLRAVDLDRHGAVITSISFTQQEERRSSVVYSAPLAYMYEPNAAILKAGAFKWVAQKYHFKKLAPNTHLYTSDQRIDFPGRTFRIIEQLQLDKKTKEHFAAGYANILTRNFPMSVEQIKKKTRLKEGGEQYLICTRSEKHKYSLIADRIW